MRSLPCSIPSSQVSYAFNAAVILFALTTALSSVFNYVWGLKGSTVMQVRVLRQDSEMNSPVISDALFLKIFHSNLDPC